MICGPPAPGPGHKKYMRASFCQETASRDVIRLGFRFVRFRFINGHDRKVPCDCTFCSIEGQPPSPL